MIRTGIRYSEESDERIRQEREEYDRQQQEQAEEDYYAYQYYLNHILPQQEDGFIPEERNKIKFGPSI